MKTGFVGLCHEKECLARQRKREKRQQFIRDLPWIIGAFVLFVLMSSIEFLSCLSGSERMGHIAR